MIDVDQVLALHATCVERWHHEPLDNPYTEVYELICAQHAWNYQLWHEEDVARSPDVGDGRIAQAKRHIDRFNQSRNDAIERVDDAITAWLGAQQIRPAAEARLNTETLGSVIDRLSILSLRLYHMEEQTRRTDASPQHLASVRGKLAICREQLRDLSQALRELWSDIQSGHKRHKTYRQLKMYNDPNLNPYLYQSGRQIQS